jgi:catalase (peroxidase I)
MASSISFDGLVNDLETLVKEKQCGPILVRLSWHDAQVYSDGKLKGGCPNAVLRFQDGGEGTFVANTGLHSVALTVLQPITEKYVESGFISNADLWALAANVAIKVMGGPDVPMRFGRKDAKDSSESVESQVGRMPEGDQGASHIREIFYPKGFNDQEIVALSGAHTLGSCHLDRTGFDGTWTENDKKFDNAFYTDLMTKHYVPETTSKGRAQYRCPETNTMMLISDMALIEDEKFRPWVEKYAADQDLFFKDFVKAWVKVQELGCHGLREKL